GSYTGVLASTLPGRDAAHGGLSYTTGGKTYDDGMIFKGVTKDGKPNQAIIPASQYYKTLNNFDEAWIYSSSFIKLREVKLSYELPTKWMQNIHFVGATVSLVGRNLWIIHRNIPNVDPETAFNTGNGQGLEDLSLPGTRSYGINVNFKF